MHAVVTGHGSMSGFSLDDTICSLEDAGHKTERAEALGDDVGLYIPIVVLAGPDKATVGLHAGGDHIVDEAMLVPELLFLELGFVVLFVNALEDVLETTVISL